MKLLMGVLGGCLLLLAALAWHLTGAARALPRLPNSPPALRRAPAEQTRAAEAQTPTAKPTLEKHPAPSTPVGTVATAPTGSGATPSDVRWATDPTLKDALRRLEAARAALRDDPNHESALRDQLAALVELGQWRGAADTLARLLELHPDDLDLRFEQAANFMRLRQWLDAIGSLKPIVAQRPEHARAWFNLAAAHQAVGHLEEARRAWDKAIVLSPHPAAYAARGEVLLDLQEWAAAAADYETVLRSTPDAPDATVNLSLALWKLGRSEEARRRLLALLEQHPRHVPALLRLAEIARAAYQAAPAGNQARQEEAAAWCRRALEIDPKQPAALALLQEITRTPGSGFRP